MIEDGEKVLFIAMHPANKWVQIIKAFAIGEHAMTSKRLSWVNTSEEDEAIPVGDPDRPTRDTCNWGRLRPRDEGIRWARGWDGEAARALLAYEALTRPADRQLANDKPIEGRDI